MRWYLHFPSNPLMSLKNLMSLKIFASIQNLMYSKTCLKQPLKKKTKIGFKDRISLNAGQKYCRMRQESILQYFPPSFSYHLSLIPLFCLFLSGRFTQVLLYNGNVIDSCCLQCSSDWQLDWLGNTISEYWKQGYVFRRIMQIKPSQGFLGHFKLVINNLYVQILALLY